MNESTVQLWMSDLPVAAADNRELTILLERAATGDASAFEQVMLRTERQVMLTSRRMLGNPADAEEATQDVFIRVYKYLHRFDRSRAFEPWLYRLTVNVCNDIAARRPRAGQVVSHEDHVELPSPTAGPHDVLSADERRRLLETALQDLPAKQRSAVVLRDLQGLSTTEVADTLHVSEATVRSHLSAARLRMKRFIEKRIRRSS